MGIPSSQSSSPRPIVRFPNCFNNGAVGRRLPGVPAHWRIGHTASATAMLSNCTLRSPTRYASHRLRKVRNPKQAIAIGLREAGASKYESTESNRKNLKRTKARERHSATTKGRSGRQDDGQMTRAELYAEAKRRDILGRSKMSKRELERALR